MAFAKTYSAQSVYLKGKIIDVEVDLSKGLHAFSIVGLPDKAVEEARDRVSAAIKNSGFKAPKNHNQKIIVSLAPADIKKEGPAFDLAVALAYLQATGEIKFNPDKKVFLGELSLDGAMRPVRGVLPLVLTAKENGFEEVYVPRENSDEASLVADINIFPATTLKEVIAHLLGKQKIEPLSHQEIVTEYLEPEIDFGDIKGQQSAKRGLLIAAAGGHNAAMYGPPGTGKTMLARAFAGILPPMGFEEILEVTSIHSVAGALSSGFVKQPPFRSPHHTSSYVSMVGGGAYPRPGEITLSHRGVLFLDEFPEFERRVIDALRQPLEDRMVNISRSKGSSSFPADFILIAALNPCPCGNFGSDKICICPQGTLQKYQRKISGPIADRVDIWLEVSKIDYKELGEKAGPRETADFRSKVIQAREIQNKRHKDKTNSRVAAKNLIATCLLSTPAKSVLDQSAEKHGLSARGYHKTIKVARTIADIEGSESILPAHVLEALQYRVKENKFS